MEREPLLKTTVDLLQGSDLPLREIADGAEVGYEWLRKFKANLIPDPSINRVQALYNFLTRSSMSRACRSEARVG